MGLIAKFRCGVVTRSAGTRWVPCEEGDEGACPVELVTTKEGSTLDIHTPHGRIGYSYGGAEWLRDANFVRQEWGPAQVQVKLGAVGEDKGVNTKWATATPQGNLEMTIENPDAFDYLEPGVEYFLEIRKAQPSKARR
jgi:hypothetical protein